ncbi:MAG: GHKL domain-containing protein [Bacteroidales bacterium]|nr:GHKL domain-containing protein [Bacteroidales bacterium]
MKSGKPILRRRKIIFYYIIAVVIPGIILGYMAFRGIRNDQALREKENLKKLEISSLTFFSEIESDIGKLMDERTLDSVICGSKKHDPSILILFIKDSTGSKKLLIHQLLYLPGELIIGNSDRLNPSPLLKEGQLLEFTGKRFAEALRFYQDRIIKTTDPEEKKVALVASARLYNRLNRPEEAKAVYEEIRKDYPGSLLNDRIPVGLMACLEIMKINVAAGEQDELRINLLKFLNLLLYPDCDYDADQFEMFYRSCRQIINETDDVTDSLFTELEIQRVRTEYLIRIMSDPGLIATRGNFRYGRGEITKYGFPVNSGELQALYLTVESNNGTQSCLVLDFPVYMKILSKKLIREIDPDSTINIKIEDINGNLVFSRVITQETGYLTFTFPDNLPKWKLFLSENRPGFITTLMKAGRGIYLFAFILIVLLMLLGFVFILYTLNVEIRLNKLKSEFISNVSHELKSPLTSIRMMTEMLHYKRVENDKRKAEYYSAMLEESQHLSHLIDNILDFSRIDEDRKKYEFDDLDLDKLTREFIKSISEMIRGTGFKVNYSCTDKVPVIRADRNAILQVLYNLVDNAIKFSRAYRQIDINLVSKDSEIQLSVKDYGIGISAKDQEKIFERFYRCKETLLLGIRGSGIGLAIVKRIVEDHGGHLTVESKPGEGSTFTVRFPVS